MANEETTGAPLTAAVGEQLAEKAHLDELREEEKRASDAVERRVERKKAGERADAMRHAAASSAAPARGGWRTWSTWQRAAAGAGAFAALLLLRRALR